MGSLLQRVLSDTLINLRLLVNPQIGLSYQ